MEVVYLQEALDDLQYWKKSGQQGNSKKNLQTYQSIEKTPYEGIGKPEGLKSSYRQMVKKNYRNRSHYL